MVSRKILEIVACALVRLLVRDEGYREIVAAKTEGHADGVRLFFVEHPAVLVDAVCHLHDGRVAVGVGPGIVQQIPRPAFPAGPPAPAHLLLRSQSAGVCLKSKFVADRSSPKNDAILVLLGCFPGAFVLRGGHVAFLNP